MSASSGIEIRELTTVEQVHEAAGVLDEVWPGEHSTMPANILRALEHAGNYVVGLYEDGRMRGASAAFFGPPASRSMHSHITGIVPALQGRGAGRALKLHQRDWARERGVERITWTFDPLVARNAHFNLRVLGAGVAEYLVDHYGSMRDDVNRGDASDRLLASWELSAPPATAPASVSASVALPSDIAALRAADPSEAAEWRVRMREQFLAQLAEGRRVVGIDARGYLFD